MDENVISHAYQYDLKKDYKDRGYDEIHMWSICDDGSSALIRIQETPNTCFLVLPTHIDDNLIDWKNSSYYVEQILNNFRGRMKENTFYDYEIVEKHLLHYYSNETRTMLKLYFKLDSHVRHIKNILKYDIKI